MGIACKSNTGIAWIVGKWREKSCFLGKWLMETLNRSSPYRPIMAPSKFYLMGISLSNYHSVLVGQLRRVLAYYFKHGLQFQAH